jgi:hypothetical protein
LSILSFVYSSAGIASHFWCRIRLPHIGSTHDMLADVSRERVRTVIQKAASDMKASTYSHVGPWTGLWPAHKGERPNADAMVRLSKAIESVLMKTLKKVRAADIPSEVRMAITQWVVLALPHAREIDKLCPSIGAAAPQASKKLTQRISTANYMFQTQVRVSVGRVDRRTEYSVHCTPD